MAKFTVKTIARYLSTFSFGDSFVFGCGWPDRSGVPKHQGDLLILAQNILEQI